MLLTDIEENRKAEMLAEALARAAERSRMTVASHSDGGPDLTKDSGDNFLDYLEVIAREDAAGLKEAQASYGNSWKSRGGIGAYMMLARKWDRLENRVKRDTYPGPTRFNDFEKNSRIRYAPPWDIFAHIMIDPRAEGVIDDVRDLRRYLMLVEAEMRARGFNADHRDNKKG